MQEAAGLANDDGEFAAVALPLAVAPVLQVPKSECALLPEGVTQEGALCDGGRVDVWGHDHLDRTQIDDSNRSSSVWGEPR